MLFSPPNFPSYGRGKLKPEEGFDRGLSGGGLNFKKSSDRGGFEGELLDLRGLNNVLVRLSDLFRAGVWRDLD